MSPEVKSFIEDSIDLIDQNNFKQLFLDANDKLKSRQLDELIKVLELVGLDLVTDRLSALETCLLDAINDHRTTPYYLDKSGSWSRLQYLLEETGLFGFDYETICQHLLTNQTRLGLKMSVLPIEYCWMSENDYDLGWFNRAQFAKEQDMEYV